MCERSGRQRAHFKLLLSGSGDSSMVRAPDSRSKGRGFESRQERLENFLLQCQLSVLLFLYPFRTRATAVCEAEDGLMTVRIISVFV